MEFSYEATTIGKKTSGASFLVQESPRAKSGWRRYDGLKLGIIPVGSSLCGFTEKGITFCTGGILMQGLRHWKANFWGFNLAIHRHFLTSPATHRHSICPTGQNKVQVGTILCRPAIYCADDLLYGRPDPFDPPRHGACQLCQLGCTEPAPRAYMWLFCTLLHL